jgi:hypothetical protein
MKRRGAGPQISRTADRSICFLSAALLLCCFAVFPASAQSSITLRTFARVAETEPVRLAHIAILDGPEAEALADAVILPADHPRRRPGQWATLELADLRTALEDRADVPWARVTLRGGRCSVGPAAPRQSDDTNGTAEPRAVEPPFTADNADLSRVRGHVAVKLAQYFGVEPADLRIRFEDTD